jgi:hypothetical protein
MRHQTERHPLVMVSVIEIAVSLAAGAVAAAVPAFAGINHSGFQGIAPTGRGRRFVRQPMFSARGVRHPPAECRLQYLMTGSHSAGSATGLLSGVSVNWRSA